MRNGSYRVCVFRINLLPDLPNILLLISILSHNIWLLAQVL